jgi:hypothetical protein
MAALLGALALVFVNDTPARRRALVAAARREGSVAVKLLQLAVSSRFLRGGLAEHLREELLSRALPQPWPATHAALVAFAEARPDLLDVAALPSEPGRLASGALAEVLLHGEIAYKVVHAGAPESVARLRGALSRMLLVPHRAELAAFLDDIEAQLDMREEARRLAAARAAWGFEDAASPQPLLRAPRSLGATRRVLAMSAEAPARHAYELPGGAPPGGLAAVACYGLWALHLAEGEVHGDLHEGNYAFDEAGRAVLYDFGLTLRVSPAQRACAAAMDAGDFRAAFAAMAGATAECAAARRFEARARALMAEGVSLSEAMRRAWPLRGPVPFGDLSRCSLSTQVAALERAVGFEGASPEGASKAAMRRAALAETAAAAARAIAAPDAGRFEALRDAFLARAARRGVVLRRGTATG